MLFNTQDRLKTALKYWSNHTYQERFERLMKAFPDDKGVLALKDAIEFQFPLETKMNGYSIPKRRVYDADDKCKRIRSKYYKKFGPQVAFTDLYYHLEESNSDWTPVEYMYGVCKTLVNEEDKTRKFAAQRHMTEREYIGRMCGRALRALPSFIREDQMTIALKDQFEGCELNKDAATDKEKHADIVMNWNDKTYYIWSYVDTNNSLKNVKKKLGGSRGDIPNGLHLFAPYNLAAATKLYGYKFYPNYYFTEMKKTAAEIPQNYNEFAKTIRSLSDCGDQDKFFGKIALTEKESV